MIGHRASSNPRIYFLFFCNNTTQSKTNIVNNKRKKKFLPVLLFILLHDKFLQSDWPRAVVFQLNLKYLHDCENYKPFAGSSINK